MNKQSNKIQTILMLMALFFLITVACVSYPEANAPASTLPNKVTQVQQDSPLNVPTSSENQEEVLFLVIFSSCPEKNSQ